MQYPEYNQYALPHYQYQPETSQGHRHMSERAEGSQMPWFHETQRASQSYNNGF